MRAPLVLVIGAIGPRGTTSIVSGYWPSTTRRTVDTALAATTLTVITSVLSTARER